MVFLVKENRTFDTFYGTYPGADGATEGELCDGTTIPLKPATDDQAGATHSFMAGITAINGGQMNCFDQTFPEGLHRMTGQQVLGFSRTRHSLPKGDFDRSLNQGVVLKSALTQFRSEFAKDPTRLYSWLGAGLRNTETNVPVDELMRLAGLAQSLRAQRVTNLVALGSSDMLGSQSIVRLSDANNALWQDLAQDGFILQKAIPADAQPSP